MGSNEWNFEAGSYWILGAGVFCKRIIKDLLLVGQVQGIVDNCSEKWGEVIEGIEVLPFSKMLDSITFMDTVICCCNKPNYKVAKDQLESFKITRHKWFMEYSTRELVFGDFMETGYDDRLVSRCCTYRDFLSDKYKKIGNEIFDGELKRYRKLIHRKPWEWVYITMCLEHAGMLQEGKRGIGFAVGKEPLPCYFASKGVEILATDLSVENEKSKAWISGDMNAAGDISQLYFKHMCTIEQFRNKVSYIDLDMNHMPGELGGYDFCWSSCAIEHVGNLELSKTFLKNMLNVLKPGGIAIHTTEFNLSSNESTIEHGDSVIYRKVDIEEYVTWCRKQGHDIEVSFVRGCEEDDMYVDIKPPFQLNPQVHLCLEIGGYVSTSFAIIVKKAMN